jgi:hypothetical protein
MICTARPLLRGWSSGQIEGDEMGGSCGTFGAGGEYVQFLVGKQTSGGLL